MQSVLDAQIARSNRSAPTIPFSFNTHRSRTQRLREWGQSTIDLAGIERGEPEQRSAQIPAIQGESEKRVDFGSFYGAQKDSTLSSWGSIGSLVNSTRRYGDATTNGLHQGRAGSL